MVLKKTCWLTTIHPLRIGCLTARAAEEISIRSSDLASSSAPRSKSRMTC